MSSVSQPEVWTAIVTPFNGSGHIDFAAFDKVLNLQAEGQVTGVVVSGTTGESPTLSDAEKIQLIKRARAMLPKSIRVMAGTGSNDTVNNLKLSIDARDAGADSLLIVTPPYSKPSMAGLTRHFTEIANGSGLPICLYHVPGRTGQLLQPGQIAQLTKINDIKWVKEASGDLTLFGRACIQSTAMFLSGDDFTYLGSLAVGGRGVVSVVTNIFPRAFVEMGRLFVKGDVGSAREIHQILLPFVDSLFCESNPGPAKAALHFAKLIENRVRMPLAEVTNESYATIRDRYTKARDQLRELNLVESAH